MGADLLRVTAAAAASIGHSAYLLDLGRLLEKGRQLPADEKFRCTDDLLARGRRTEHLIRPGLHRPGAHFDASADGERQYREVGLCSAELLNQLCPLPIGYVQIDDSQIDVTVKATQDPARLGERLHLDAAPEIRVLFEHHCENLAE